MASIVAVGGATEDDLEDDTSKSLSTVSKISVLKTPLIFANSLWITSWSLLVASVAFVPVEEEACAQLSFDDQLLCHRPRNGRLSRPSLPIQPEYALPVRIVGPLCDLFEEFSPSFRVAFLVVSVFIRIIRGT